MADSRTVLLQGTLDLLILRALLLRSNHGFGVARRVKQITRGTFASVRVPLPAQRRLRRAGLVKIRVA
jgi:DNA-binding PadR family transcriptional regulator